MTKTRKLIALAVIPLLSLIGICMDLPSTSHQAPVAAAEISFNQPSIQSVITEGTVDSTNNESNVIPAYMPNDSHFDKQWAFNNIQTPDITSTTPEIIVAIIDTGIDEQHEDLVGKVITSINFTDSPTSSDISGHGTHIAGIISATTNNAIGIAGAAPNTRLLNVKAVEDNGMVCPSTIAKGIIWAVDNGAKIINMSLLVPATSSALEEAVDYAWSKGVVLIAASGNYMKSVPVYPACYSQVIAVAATDIDGDIWSGSNCGKWIDAYAPGVDIYSTIPDNKYGYRSGTSMSTAYVTAAAALNLTTAADVNNNGLLNDEITKILTENFPTPAK